MVVVVTADIQTGVPVPPCVSSGTWQVHKHACITRWQCWDTAVMHIGTFELPGSRTSCENRSMCIAIWQYRIWKVCKWYAFVTM